MPELPEVETVIGILKPLIIGKEIQKVEVYYDRLIQSDLDAFKATVINKKITSITRYGKYIYIHLSDDFVIITHLRMEGKFRYLDKGNQRIKHTSAMFFFKDGTYLSFDDTRKFAIMYLTNEAELPTLPMISKLGIEANKVEEKDLPELFKKFNKNKPIKELLLDQSILCGIGNIYADEICYATKLNPYTKGKDISKEKIIEITKQAKIILNKAIELGGSTIHSFHPSEGVDGKFQEVLMCYGREGELCPRCSTKFHKDFIGGRGTTYCPNCQINHELEKAIGITGPIGSGKSTALKYLKEKGYRTYSADEIVHELYRMPHIQRKVSSIIKAPFDIDNKELTLKARKILIAFPERNKELQNYIHPLVENEFLNILKSEDNPVFEVPLLFKAHYEYMFKKILVISISKEQQLKNLASRNENIETSKKLNYNFEYPKDNPKIKVVEATGNFETFYKNIEKALD